MAGLFAGFGLLQLGRQLVSVNARFEDLRQSLSAVSGSVLQGKDAFKFIQDFAQSVPIDIETLTKSFITLKSSGIEPTAKLLTTFADAATATTDRLGTFNALTRVLARSVSGGLGLEELNQIADRGVNVFKILEESLGVTRLEISEFGKTAEGAKTLIDALLEGLDESFGGAAAAGLDNLSTKMSNLGDVFNTFLDRIGDAGGGISFLKSLLDGLISTFQFLADNAETVGNILAGIVAGGVAAGFLLIAKNIRVAVVAVRALTIALLANPLFLIPAVIALAVAAFLEFKDSMITIGDTSATVSDFFQATWEVTLQRVETAFDIFVLKSIRNLLRVNDAIGSLLPDVLAPSTLTDEQKKFADSLDISEAFKGSGEAIANRAAQLRELREATKNATDANDESNKSGGLSIDVRANELSLLRGEIDQLRKLAAASEQGQEAFKKLNREMALNKRELEIRNKLIKEGVTITPEMTQEIRSLTAAEADLKKQIEENVAAFEDQSSVLKDFAADVRDFQTQFEQAAVNAFKGIEDAIIELAKNGKLTIKDLVNSILTDLARIGIRRLITGPLLGLIGFEKGGVFENQQIVPFANGDILTGPTLFPMSGNKTGLAGEAGPEAIMPLSRGIDGRLGVEVVNAPGRAGIASSFSIAPNVTISLEGTEFIVSSDTDIERLALDIARQTGKATMEILLNETRKFGILNNG